MAKSQWLKTGPLSEADRDFILQSVATLSLESVASKLNRSPSAIKRFCEKNDIKFRRAPKQALSDKLESEEIMLLKAELRNKNYYDEICAQLDFDEVIYFENRWVSIVQQFKQDILPTEEMQIKQLLSLDILINRLMKDQKRHKESISELENMLKSLYKDKENLGANADRMAALEEQLANAKNTLGTYNSQHERLLAKFGDIMEKLKGTREQRIKIIEDSKKNWTGLLKALEEEEIKQFQGQHMTLMKELVNETRKEYFQYHEFADNTVYPPIMTAESIQHNAQLDAEAKKIKETTI